MHYILLGVFGIPTFIALILLTAYIEDHWLKRKKDKRTTDNGSVDFMVIQRNKLKKEEEK